MKRTADINDILKPLADTPYQAYLSNAVQVADILEWIVRQVGVSEVWQTSFSISEEFLRRLFFLKKSCPISRFNLILDHLRKRLSFFEWFKMGVIASVIDIIDNHSVPLNDLFNQRLETNATIPGTTEAD